MGATKAMLTLSAALLLSCVSESQISDEDDVDNIVDDAVLEPEPEQEELPCLEDPVQLALDRDEDGTPDCADDCPDDAGKIEPGMCGCDVPDDDRDLDGIPDCQDDCPDTPNESVACVDGFAGRYPCDQVELMSHLPLATFGSAGNANDLWTWTDPVTLTPYALLGLSQGVAIIDLTQPFCPTVVAWVDGRGRPSMWRDLKTLGDYLFIGSESLAHGVQIVDLTEVRDYAGQRLTLVPKVDYLEVGSSHNVVIAEEAALLAVVGSETCGGGLHLVDVSDPLMPSTKACYDDFYVHDAQCVRYNGPDTDHTGADLCFTANGTDLSFSIVDVTDPDAPAEISVFDYQAALEDAGEPGGGYSHQGWLTEDHRYFLLGDEYDEISRGEPTRTFIIDLADLDAPSLLGVQELSTSSVDHNLITHDGLVYQANYTSGLRILDTVNIANGELNEIAYFDVYPQNDSRLFEGAWMVDPRLPDDLVLISSFRGGLFVVRTAFESPPE